jgi:hypothetical protein
MANKKSAKYPHKWPDGSWHSIPWAQTKRARDTGTPNPPPGSYDPNLDAQLGASQRGLGDLVTDIGGGTGKDPLGIQRVRAQDDLGIALAGVDQQRTRGLEDYTRATGNVETGYGRNLSDLLTAREQGTQDYGTNIAGLQRNYANLALSQAGAQRKAGAMPGSTASRQAAGKRAANEEFDRAPIDTAYKRFTDASRLNEGRLGEDRSRGLDDLLTTHKRGEQDLTTQGDRIGLGYDRQNADWTTQLSRAKREGTAFGADVLSAKVAQFIANNPDADVPYIPGPFVPSEPKPKTLAAGPGVPGTKTTKRKNKRGQTVVTYSNAVTTP